MKECKWEKTIGGYIVQCFHGVYFTDEPMEDWKYCPFCSKEIVTVIDKNLVLYR